jgi:poly(A) polymerase/tRNA nucleotidyltransferase (CCA-adding enzyme)
MKVRLTVPSYVQKVARSLIKEGYEVYLVGGAIRDILMGKKPNDYDLATNALPDEMLEIFPKSVSVGAKFGTILALVKDSQGETQEVEVTTFRSESDYTDGRWPTNVKFVEKIDKDLGRRDFTINAMALDLSSNDLDGEEVEKEWEILDPFNGITDISLKVIRAVGTPIERFKEDGLRAFKACRLASQLDFEIEPETFKAIQEAIPVAKQISMERIRDEFMKMLNKSPRPSKGIELMRQAGLLAIFLPELIEGVGVEQKLFHADDVYTHSLKACDFAQDDVKLAALLHDIAKPRTDMGNGHFYGHDVMGAQMTEEIMKRMKFPKSEIERVVNLVRNHMFYYPHVAGEINMEALQEVMLNQWSDSAVRRFLKRVGDENVEDLFRLRIADATSNPKSAFQPEEINQLQEHISKVRQEDMALKVSDLAISGDDLVAIGMKPGKRVGEILNALLDMVIEDPLLNTKKKLLDEAARML